MINKIKEVIKKFSQIIYHQGLQFTLLVSFSLVAVGMILIVTFVYSRRLFATHEEMLKSNNTANLEQVSFGLDQSLQNIMQAANISYYDILKDADLEKDKETLEKELSFLLRVHNPQITNIAVFDSHGDPLIVVPKQSSLRPETSVYQEKWFINAMAQIENIHISPPTVDRLFEPVENEYPRVVTFSKNVEMNRKGDISQGVLMLNMDFAGMERILKQPSNTKLGSLFLTDMEGKVIYHPQQLLLNEKWLQVPNLVKRAQDGVYQDKQGKNKQMVAIKTLGYTGWKLVGTEPIDQTKLAFTDNRLIIWGLAALASLSLLAINMVVSSKITTPLRNLEKAVTQIEESLDDLKIPVEGTYEIQHLAQALTTMTDTMKRLMKDIVSQQEKMRENELSVLQAQINPHFLYNTLDSTVWMIEIGHYEESIQMITALAKFFRLSLSKGKQVITLGEELEHVKNYLTIQEYRYKNKFTATITVEEEDLKSKSCLKLILQPMVENAIYHGMDYMTEDGEILIHAYRVPEGITIDVTDNGPGMTEKQVEALVNGEITSKKGSGVGFKNVSERIKLHYGAKYGVTVISEPDEGTTVRILIPEKETDKG